MNEFAVLIAVNDMIMKAAEEAIMQLSDFVSKEISDT